MVTERGHTEAYQKIYSILKELVQKRNCHSVGELVRRIIVKNKIRFYSVDSMMDIPINEIIRIKEELNAIARNINQITHEFHTADYFTSKKISSATETGP